MVKMACNSASVHDDIQPLTQVVIDIRCMWHGNVHFGPRRWQALACGRDLGIGTLMHGRLMHPVQTTMACNWDGRTERPLDGLTGWNSVLLPLACFTKTWTLTLLHDDWAGYTHIAACAAALAALVCLGHGCCACRGTSRATFVGGCRLVPWELLL